MKPSSVLTSTSWRSNRLDVILFAISMATLGLLYWMLTSIVPEAFQIHYNPYSLVSLAGLGLNVALNTVLLRRSNSSNSVLWFSLFLVFGSLWSGAEAMERSAVTAVGAAYWGDLIAGVTTFMPAFFYLFVRSYTDKENARLTLWVPAYVIGTAAMMGALMAGRNVYKLSDSVQLQPWGYPGPNSVVSLLFIIWAGLLTFAAIGRLISFYRHAGSRNNRRLTGIFIISATGLIIVSGLTEVILPLIGVTFVPPLGVFSNAMLAAGVIFGIYKYGSFSVGADEIADSVLSTMGDGVVVTDLEYRVVYRNNRAQEMLGVAGGDLLGENLRTLYGVQFDSLAKLWEQALVSTGSTTIDELEVGTGDKALTMNINVTPLSADRHGYIFVLIDITKIHTATAVLKEKSTQLEAANKSFKNAQTAMLNLLEDARDLEAQLKDQKADVENQVEVQTAAVKAERFKLEAALNGIDIAVYMLDEKLELGYANKATEKFYTDLTHRPWSPVEYQAMIRAVPEYAADIKDLKAYHHAIEHPALSVADRVLRTYHSPIPDPTKPKGAILGIVSSVQDITEAKAAERSRDEFFSIASHELRTPLTAIRGNTSMIIDYFSEQIKDPTLSEMIGDIHDSSIRLITIVNDFLNTSRLEQGKIEFKIAEFDPSDLVEEVIKEFKAGDSGAKVPIRASLEPVDTVLADRDRIKEVLINLIGNAVKFTDTGAITVSLHQEGDKVKLSVTDTGKGIPLESQNLLFRKFQQASNNILTRDSTRSTGLGLYISKLMCAGMACEIFLEQSAAGKGSIFSVRMPKAPHAKTAKALGGVKA